MARPIMTASELASHHTDRYGRDYNVSCDGYDDMEQAEKAKWHSISGWGLDGWDMGEWPYVAIYSRNHADRFEVQSVVEGDHDVYTFDTQEDQYAALDYLFVWYGLGKEYDEWLVNGLSPDKRQALDDGYLRVPERFRGPFSWERLDAIPPAEAS